MSKVVIDLSISVDGFIAGPNESTEQPLGEGGEVLHRWMFSGHLPSRYSDFFRFDEASRSVMDEAFGSEGAVLFGRRTYDLVDGWHGSYPIPGVSVVIMTHHPPAADEVPQGSSDFQFVTGGVEEAVARAKAVAGDRTVNVGGASAPWQCLAAGLADELRLHVVPVVLGRGVRLFPDGELESVALARPRVIESTEVTHLIYEVSGGV